MKTKKQNKRMVRKRVSRALKNSSVSKFGTRKGPRIGWGAGLNQKELDAKNKDQEDA